MKSRFITSLFILFSIATLHAAKITWTPETGYQSDEVEMSGLLPEETRQVLNLMNSARQAEEFESRGRGKLHYAKKGGNDFSEGKQVKSYRKALKKYRKIVKKFPKSQYAPEAYNRIALISLARNEIDDAYEAYERMAWDYPNYGSFNETIGEMYKIAETRLNTHRVKIFGVIPGFLNIDRAVSYFERIYYIAPYSDYSPLALLNIAQTWDEKGKDDMAIYALDRLVLKYPDSVHAPDAYLKLAKKHTEQTNGPYYDQSSTKTAISFYQDFLFQYPEDDGVVIAETELTDAQNTMAMSKVKIADFYYYKRKKLEAAKVIYNEAITLAPKSATAKLARIKIDQIQAKLDVQEAITEEEQKALADKDQKTAKKRARRKILGIF